MSLAVLLDQNVRWEGKGPKDKRILEPPSAEKIKTIRELVAAATGFSEPRGDQLTVETLPFESTLGLEAPVEPSLPSGPPASPLPPWLVKILEKMPLGLQIGVAVAAMVLLIAPIVLLLKRRKRKSVEAATSQKALEGDPAVSFEGQLASRAANQEKLDAEALLALKLPPAGTKKSDILAKHLKAAVKADPVVSAQLLRTWMNEDK